MPKKPAKRNPHKQTNANQQQGQSQRPPSRVRPTPVSTKEAMAKAKEAVRAAHSEAEAKGHESTQPEGPSDRGSALDYAEAVTDLQAAKRTYEQLSERLRTEQERLDQDAAVLAASRASHEQQADTTADRQRELDERAEQLDSQRDQLAHQQAEAEAGFLARRDEILTPVRRRIAELTAAWQEQELSLAADWNRRLQERRDALEQEHAARLRELTEEEHRTELARIKLTQEESAVARSQAKVNAAREVLEEDSRAFELDRDSLIARTRQESEARLRALEEERDRLLARLEGLEHDTQVLDEFRRTYGLDPTRLLADHQTMSQRISTLADELSGRPGPEVREELDHARQRLQDALSERADSLRLQRELQSQLDYQQARLEEHERLQLSNSALESSIAAYKVEIEELRAQFEQLHTDRQAHSAFPECTRMDAEFGPRAARPGADVPDLNEFVKELQIRMADDKDAREQGKRLSYRPADLRIFLAGLAMSRLHLLEGTSGTGKTTLPHAFANAVGGAARKIEVQAGWRDKQDLLGYYNSFERVYRESPCLQYLYRAGLDYFSDQIILIVLDEMNLSHPEQYFADFLSALEDPHSEPLISISDRSLPHTPANMVTKTGVQLRLPPNVWFIGTANQDETTFAFAPKTYDRAHVMELEPNAPAVPDADVPALERPVSFQSLRRAFQRAEAAHQSETRQATTYVHGLAGFFNEKFRVSWGNRLDLHIARFVPVDIAAGGSLGEALDHLMTTKVLRRLQGRHSVRPDALKELGERVQQRWVDPGHGPDRTIAAIAAEIDELQLG